MSHRVAVYVVLRRSTDVLFLLRSGTGYRDDEYGLPSGKVEPGETVVEAARREAAEETGVAMQPRHVVPAHVMERNTPTGRWLDWFFVADTWDGDPVNNEPDRAGAFDAASDAFVIGELGGMEVCCGAIRRFDATTAEVKRMYVRKIARGRGIGSRLLAELERLARIRDYCEIVLETGSEQPEALALYMRAGYSPTQAWPPYDERSYAHCFRKTLRRP